MRIVHYTEDGQIKKEFKKKLDKPIVSGGGVFYNDNELEIRLGYTKSALSGVILRVDKDLNETYFGEYTKDEIRATFKKNTPEDFIPRPGNTGESKFYKGRYYGLSIDTDKIYVRCYKIKRKEKFIVYEQDWVSRVLIKNATRIHIINIADDKMYLSVDAFDEDQRSRVDKKYHHDHIISIDIVDGGLIYQANLYSNLSRNISYAWFDHKQKKIVVAGNGADRINDKDVKVGYFISPIDRNGEFEDLDLRNNPTKPEFSKFMKWKPEEAFLEFNKAVEHEDGSYSLIAQYTMPRDIVVPGNAYASERLCVFGFAIVDLTSSMDTKSTTVVPHLENTNDYSLTDCIYDFTSNGKEKLLIYTAPSRVYMVKINNGTIERHEGFSSTTTYRKYIPIDGNKLISVTFEADNTWRLNEEKF